MKAIALLGSPRRNGNSSGLAQTCIDQLTEKGYEVESFNLNSLNLKGCQACDGCKGKSETCIIMDDLSPILEKIKDADILILASPVYWGEVSAQMKAFIDRTYSLLTPEFITGPIRHRLPPGKKLIFILSQGADNAMYEDIFPRYNNFWQQLEMFAETHLIRGCELSANSDYKSRSDLLDAAKDVVEAVT